MLRLDSKDSQHLAKSILLEESGSPILTRTAIRFVLSMIGLFILWSAVTDVEEIASAPGDIVPTGQVQKIQHIEDGRIAEILVSEGEFVEKSQVLMRIDALVSQSELSQTQSKLVTLRLQKERLSAFITRREPSFSDIDGAESSATEEQLKIYRQQVASHESAKDILSRQIDQYNAELEQLSRLEKTLSDKAAYFEQEMAIARNLFKDGLISKVEYLGLQRQESDIKGELDAVPPQREQMINRIAEFQSRLSQIDSQYMETALTDQEKIDNEITQINEIIRRHQRLVNLSEIRAPVAGYVHVLTTHTIGGVVSAGDTILEIVPKDHVLIAEIKISPTDIGHVSIDQPVSLKLASYDFSRYGAATGKLSKISATTIADKQGQPYYKGEVSLASNYIEGRRGRFPILPGMTLVADVKTGDKSILEYILKPIYASSHQALRER